MNLPDDFIPHEQGDCPVHPETTVIAMMEDGPLSPLKAKDIDWDFPGDPVLGYKVVEEYVPRNRYH